MAQRTAGFIVLALLIGAGHASAQKVTTDFDPGVKFAAVKTYYWAKSDPAQNDLMNQRIVAAVDHWLTLKGWTKAPEAEADVAVIPLVTTQAGQTLNTFYDGFGGGWGFRGWGAATSTTTVSNYTQGTLIVDLYDRQSKKLMWRGTATDTIPNDPKKVAEKIQKSAEKMFKKNFPPGVVQTS